MNLITKKRILIAGGYGLVGSTIARYIRELHKDIEIIIAGRDSEKGAVLAKELGNARTVYLDINKAIDFESVGKIDLIIASLNDRSDSLIHYAMAHDAAHIGITKLADDLAPITFYALKNPPKRPVALLGHWLAGVLTTVALKEAELFNKVGTIESICVFDPQDPIGEMVKHELQDLVGRGLVRENGKWKWIVASEPESRVTFSNDIVKEAIPLGTLDVPSLAAITSAENIKVGLAQGDSMGTLAGGKASHDIYIDLEGELKSGEKGKRRVIVSCPNGSSHLTALGVLVAAERILEIDGEPAAPGGIHTAETLIQPDLAIARFKKFGVEITHQELSPVAEPEKTITL